MCLRLVFSGGILAAVELASIEKKTNKRRIQPSAFNNRLALFDYFSTICLSAMQLRYA